MREQAARRELENTAMEYNRLFGAPPLRDVKSLRQITAL